MEDYTPHCRQIRISLDRVMRGIGERSYELQFAKELLDRIPSPSKEIYEKLIEDIKRKTQ